MEASREDTLEANTLLEKERDYRAVQGEIPADRPKGEFTGLLIEKESVIQKMELNMANVEKNLAKRELHGQQIVIMPYRNP